MLQPKFSGVLGEALDVAARWSGDVVSTYAIVFTLNLSFWWVHWLRNLKRSSQVFPIMSLISCYHQ